uniref:Uncharacterized protein n=1 Tax=Amphimedon queenslandica TaxID=400682 RepID=A0A1X7TW85_AMPQE
MESFGWTAFFEELENVFSLCQSQIGIANEGFVDYVTQKLELSLQNVKKIQEVLEIAIEPETELEEEEVVVRKYLDLISTLQSCIIWLLSYWDAYL